MPEATNSPFTCKVRSHGWVAWACKVTVFPGFPTQRNRSGRQRHFKRAVRHIVKDVPFVGSLADKAAIGVSEDKGQLFDGFSSAHAVILSQGQAPKIETVHGALHWQQHIAVVGLAQVAVSRPGILDMLPVRGGCALACDDTCMSVDERAA